MSLASDASRDEAVAHLDRLIQIDTTNPPGNELVLARYLAAQREAAGVEPHLRANPAPADSASVGN